MRKVLLVVGLAAVALTGCSSLEKLNSEEANLVQLDSSTYRLSLYQPWMKQEVRVREAAREDAVAVCAERGQGMQAVRGGQAAGAGGSRVLAAPEASGEGSRAAGTAKR